jgi:hypothetical protein
MNNATTYPTAAAQTPHIFSLPAGNRDNDRVIAYLRGRGISLPLIQDCIHRGALYEDTRHNCVFVGFDIGGEPRYAALRGTYGNFKGEATGSDKHFGFTLPCAPLGNYTMLTVTESAIDALSYSTLFSDRANAVLALSGVTPLALERHLQYCPQIHTVQLALDMDETGKSACERIAAFIRQKFTSKECVRITPAHPCKDWNEMLCR